jgi:hypothetical protein
MTHQRQTGTGRQPPALSRARQSRKKLPAALTVPRLAGLAASLPLLLAIAGAASPAASAGVTAAQAASKDDFSSPGIGCLGRQPARQPGSPSRRWPARPRQSGRLSRR